MCRLLAAPSLPDNHIKLDTAVVNQLTATEAWQVLDSESDDTRPACQC